MRARRRADAVWGWMQSRRHRHGACVRSSFVGALFALAATCCLLTACALASTTTGRALSAAPSIATSISPRLTTRLLTTPQPTTGCGHAPPIPAGASANETLVAGGLTRNYRLHIPSSYAAERRQPLVLAFHGHGSDAILFERLTGFSSLADARDFLVVYPQGAVGPGARTGWNTSRAKDPKTNDLLFVSDLLTRLQAQLCVDPQRIYATGFSNGGGFTMVLACDFADRIAAFASVSGDYYPQPGGCKPAQPTPLLEIHGTADSIIPIAGSQRLDYPSVSAWLQAWAMRDGCASGPTVLYHVGDVTGEAWKGCQGDGAVLHYQITDGVHVWPGAAPSKRLPSGDTQFHATGVIWSFFAERALPRE